jgi:hypothetical protein
MRSARTKLLEIGLELQHALAHAGGGVFLEIVDHDGTFLKIAF